MSKVIENITTRRSIRKYKNDEVPMEIIEKILKIYPIKMRINLQWDKLGISYIL